MTKQDNLFMEMFAVKVAYKMRDFYYEQIDDLLEEFSTEEDLFVSEEERKEWISNLHLNLTLKTSKDDVMFSCKKPTN